MLKQVGQLGDITLEDKIAIKYWSWPKFIGNLFVRYEAGNLNLAFGRWGI